MTVTKKDGLVYQDVDHAGRHAKYLRMGAILSEDLQYRYVLTRVWNPDRPKMLCIMLNPSTAEGVTDDATIRKVHGFATVYGVGELEVLNLYAYRATDPKELFGLSMAERVGPRNDEFLESAMRSVAAKGGLVVVGWGANAEPEREQRFLELSLGQWCWGVNKNGSPKHPLYLPGATALSVWPQV